MASTPAKEMENLLPTSQPTTTPAAAKASVTPAKTVIPSTTPQATTTNNNQPTTVVGVAADYGTQDTSVKKLEMKVAGFIDISGMVSTVGVLVLLMGQPTRNVYFVPLAIFISLSLILQCVLAVVLIIRHTFVEEAHLPSDSVEDAKRYNMKSRLLLTVSSILLLLITVINVFIVAFGGVATHPTIGATSSTTSNPN